MRVENTGLQHPVVSVVEVPTLTLVLAVSDLSLHLPGDVEREPARHRDLLVRVAGDGEEGVPVVDIIPAFSWAPIIGLFRAWKPTIIP